MKRISLVSQYHPNSSIVVWISQNCGDSRARKADQTLLGCFEFWLHCKLEQFLIHRWLEQLAPVWAHAFSVVLKRYSTRYNWCIVFKTTLLPEESYSWECACRALPTVWDWTWIMKGTMSIGVMKATRGRKLQWGLWGVQFPSKLEVTADFHIYGLGSAFIKLVSTFQNIAERAWLWDSIGTK